MKELMLTCFEVATYGVLLLLLPCIVAHQLLGCILTDILVQAMLLAVAGTGILTTIAIHEGWYLDHLSGWGLSRDRLDPRLSMPPPSAQDSADGDDARSADRGHRRAHGGRPRGQPTEQVEGKEAAAAMLPKR